MVNKNSIIYFLDIPDDIKPKLPKNLQRHCASSDTLATEFNRWLWEVGSNATDLNETWNKSVTPRAAWMLLEKEFGSDTKEPFREMQTREIGDNDISNCTRDVEADNVNKDSVIESLLDDQAVIIQHQQDNELTKQAGKVRALKGRIITSLLKPSECFDIQVLKVDYPFNIVFSTKSDYLREDRFFGPGLYSIFDKKINCIIYIGLWSIPRSVVKERFEKHIQVLTLRGTKVMFNKNNNIDLDEFINNCDSRISKSGVPYRISNQKLINALRESKSMTKGKCRLHAGGIVATAGKPRYAAENWDEFGKWGSDVQAMCDMDDRFVLQFDKINDYFYPSLSQDEIKSQLKTTFEERLIHELNPLTNREYDFTRPPKTLESEGELSGSEFISHRITEIASSE